MRFILTILCAFLLNPVAFAQVESHVKWKSGAKRISPSEANIFIIANIDEGWHIYSQDIEDGGPTKTEFTFAPSNDYMLNGKTLEFKPIVKFDKQFKMNIGLFEKEAVFQQKIKLRSNTATLNGSFKFGVCNDKTCLPPDEASFSIKVPAK